MSIMELMFSLFLRSLTTLPHLIPFSLHTRFTHVLLALLLFFVRLLFLLFLLLLAMLFILLMLALLPLGDLVFAQGSDLLHHRNGTFLLWLEDHCPFLKIRLLLLRLHDFRLRSVGELRLQFPRNLESIEDSWSSFDFLAGVSIRRLSITAQWSYLIGRVHLKRCLHTLISTNLSG